MTRLILIRHAKSSWDAPMDDHARSLNDRGRTSALALGRWLSEQGYVPELVIASDARRTEETARRIIAALPEEERPELRLSGKLYNAGPEALYQAAKAAEAKSVALIAHNPGIGLLASCLLAEPPAHEGFDHYPTGATTVIDFDGPIAREGGRCTDFVVPREL